MSTVFSFQTQLVSIMEALTKTAVLEISKLVEIESKMLKIEINRGRNEIASLTEKLQLMEKLLHMAQGRSQDAAAAASSGMRESSENEDFLAPDRSRFHIKSAQHPCESVWETITSSTEMSLHRAEDNTANELPNSLQSELVVVKAEPLEAGNETVEQNQTSENRGEAITESAQNPGVVQNPKPIAEHQQPIFTGRFVTLSSQKPLDEPERGEVLWTAQTALQGEKSVAQNVASQSINMLRNTKLHNYRNSATKRFGCLQCGKSFRCFSQLEIHQRSHTGEKPFRCTLCGKRYAQKGHLYTHQRTHTGEKPYRCPICGKGFIQKCTLDMHQRTHTGEKPFVCINCGKGFTKNCNLKKHLAVHLDPSLNI